MRNFALALSLFSVLLPPGACCVSAGLCQKTKSDCAACVARGACYRAIPAWAETMHSQGLGRAPASFPSKGACCCAPRYLSLSVKESKQLVGLAFLALNIFRVGGLRDRHRISGAVMALTPPTRSIQVRCSVWRC